MKPFRISDDDMIELERAVCADSLLEYTKIAWPILEPGRKMISGWPIEAICEHLEAVTDGDIKRLLITVPPGSMKSLLTRVFWPTWEWGPKGLSANRFIGASYAQHLSERDNRRARTIITDPWYEKHFGLTLADDQRAKTNFGNSDMGWMMATSVHGVGTGERADRFLIDDPHNVLEAESDAKRNDALLWFRETVPSRLNDLDEDVIVCIMQRVHQEDVASVAIDLGYDHLLIPMHYDPKRSKTTSIGWTDPRTEEDELMWPERFSAKAVAKLEETLGDYAAGAQLEQTPIPRGGGLIQVDRINFIDDVPWEEIDYFIKVRGWDLASSEERKSKTNAYTVGALVAYSAATRRYYILDIWRKRVGPHKVRLQMKLFAESDGEETQIVYPRDPGQAGVAQAQEIAADLAGFTFKVEAQSGDKATRAGPFASQVEAGNVYCVNRAWTKEFKEEAQYFPNSKFKDQVDAVSSAYNHLSSVVRNGIPAMSLKSEQKGELKLPYGGTA